MKKRLLIMLVMIFGCVTGASAADKVAFVDVDKLFDNYTKTVELNKELDAKVTEKQGERDTMVNEIRRMKEEMVLLADENKAEKQAGIDETIRELQAYDEKTRTELSEERNKYMQEILVELDEKVKIFGEAEGYDYIINSRFILYKKDSFDVTGELLKEINK